MPTAEIAFVAGSGQELVRQMIKEGPSLEEKIGVALPVSDVSAYRPDMSAECPEVKTPELPELSFQLNQGSAGDFSCLALQGEFGVFGSLGLGCTLPALPALP